MAHELSIRANGFAEMAFVGETPWHELGQQVKQGATISEWTRAAGMDWQAMSAPATFARTDGTTGKTDKKVIYRSDTGKALSVMGADYQIVQPLDILEFFRSATENGGWHIHTAGVLREGRKLWAMASQDDNGALVAKGDRVRLNLLLSTSLDGTAPTTARATTVRVVCANTLAAAIGEARTAVRLSHRSVFDPAVILSAMQTAGDDFASFVKASQAMAETSITLDEAREVLRKLFVSNAAAKASAVSSVVVASAAAMAAQQTAAMLAKFGAKPAAPEAPKDHRNMARVLELFQGAGMGADSSGAKGTRWGLLNAVSQFVDHEAGRTADARIDAAWFGKGDALKSRAAELLAV